MRAGGGVAGIAWELGVLRGIQDIDPELSASLIADVGVVYADAASLTAFGTNPLSPAIRGPAARAGREIGRAEAAGLAQFWI